MPLPEIRVQVNIKMPAGVRKRVRHLAKRRQMTVQDYVLKAVLAQIAVDAPLLETVDDPPV